MKQRCHAEQNFNYRPSPPLHACVLPIGLGKKKKKWRRREEEEEEGDERRGGLFLKG